MIKNTNGICMTIMINDDNDIDLLYDDDDDVDVKDDYACGRNFGS